LNQSLRNLVCSIMTPEPISKAYFTKLSHQSVRINVYAPIVARQRLDKNISAATNISYSKILLDASFSMRSMSYQMIVCGSVCLSPLFTRDKPIF
jgi:hypothetical protein